jgi:hypothetical protein
MSDFTPNPRTEPTGVSGYRAPEDLLSNRVVVDMQDRILMYQPEATPFLTLTGKIKGKRMAKNLRFEWLEKDMKPRTIKVNGAQTDVDTTIEALAADVSKLAANDVLRNSRTGELILVSAPGTTDFTCVRNIGGGAAAMNDGDVLVILGSSYPDNATIGTMKSILEFPNYNFTQIFRTPFGFSGRDIVTELYGGDDVTTETKWQAIEHKRSIEHSFFFGKRHSIAAAGGVKQRTFTGGLENAILTNTWNVSGLQLNSRVFNEFLEEGLRWGKGGRLQGGSANKVLLCSSRWLTEINSWAESRLEYRVLDKEIGFSAMEYKSPHGRVQLVNAPLLDENTPDYAFLVDFNHVDYVYLRQRDTKLLRGREENDRDGEAFEFFSDCGLQVQYEHAHSLLKGISV